MEADGDAFWFQPPAALLPRRRRPQQAPLLNPVVLILAIPILALLILFFLLPPFLAHTNQILRPNSVKKSWDSLNVVLVLFAVLCGVFARRNDEAPPSEEAVAAADGRRVPATASTVSNFVNRPRQSVPEWMDFPDRREYSSISSGGGLRRSSSSYPDLRQESVWENEGANRSRFFDDFEVNFYRSPPPENFEPSRRRGHEAERQEAEAVVREIHEDKFEISSVPSPPPSTPPKSPTPPPPPPPPSTLKRRRSIHSVPRADIVDTRKDKAEVSQHRRQLPPPAPPPPPSPPHSPAAAADVPSPEEVNVKIHRRKSGTKELATAITSLYKGQRKRKKRVKSRNIYEIASENSSPPSAVEPQSAPPPPPPPPMPPVPPPPPPPPPPPKPLQKLFKKSGKSKRVHSVPTAAAPPPPPPPPPPNSIFNNLFKTGSKSKRFPQSSTSPPVPPPPPPPPSSILNTLFKTGSKSRRYKNVSTIPPPAPRPPPPPPPRQAEPPRRRPPNTGKPPKPTKPAEHYNENAIIAPPSPLIPLPPPPPPFRMPEVRFVARGDFVRISSTHSSRCSSPELEDDEIMSVKSESGDSMGPSVSCPSPDVNAKADSFIARLRDEWRLEKMNSAREKRKSG